MKKILYKIGILAAVFTVLLGCAKDKSEGELQGFKRTVKVTVTKDADTKTAVVEGDDKASYVWTYGDEEYFKVYENTTLGQISGIEYSDDMKKVTLTVDFNTTQAESYVYKAKFAKEMSNSGNLKIQETQEPSLTSYDPSADLFVTDEITSASAVTSLEFVMHRVATVNKMTLKGLGAGEAVSKVEVTFNNFVSGYYIYSGDNAGTYSNSGKKLTLNYTDAQVASDGSFPVFFVAMPADEIALESVVVYTDSYTYSRSEFSKTYAFPLGKMTRFGINMEGTGTPVSDTDIYTLVNSTSDLEPGVYIIAASGYDKAMGALSGDYHLSADVVKSGSTIELDNSGSVLRLELAQSGSNWTMKNITEGDSNYGKYVAWSSGNTSIEQTSSYNWTISVAGGVSTIASAATSARKLLYNAQSPRFACYTSAQQAVALYKKTGSVLPLGISFEEESYTMALGSDGYNSFEGQAVTKEASDSRTVTYTLDGDPVGTINSASGQIFLNNVNTGTATVTASVPADATHSSGSVSYTITVTAGATEADVLDHAFFDVSGTTYTDKSGLVGSSGRGSLYSSNTAGGNNAIQIRSDKKTSGIVTTASGGNVAKIEVTWNSNTASGRVLQVYGKNTAYSSPSDLYGDDKGTLLGTITYGSQTSLTISGNYAYIGLRSSDGAMYLDQILVYWTDGSGVTTPKINITSANPVAVSKAGGSQTSTYSITNPVDGTSLTVSSNVSWISGISVGSSSITYNVAAQEEGARSRTGVLTLAYSGAASVQITVSQEAGEGGSQAANGWLELPATTTGSDYFSGTLKAGNARNYTYLYQYSTYTSLWTAYPLYPATMGSSTVNLGPYYPSVSSEEVNTKGTTWAANPQIDKSKQINVWSGSYGVSVANPPYVSDIYARGHQIPNSDRSSNGTMQSQTYYATNSTPQIQNRFNGYIWNQLEQAVRGCVSDTVYVVTGATFHKVGGSETITYIKPAHDSRSVPVPYYYWKVLLKVKRSGSTITSASAIGFWFEHKQYSNNDFTPYAVSVNKIEEYTGFDFFVNLPSNLETTAEANTSWTTFKNF